MSFHRTPSSNVKESYVSAPARIVAAVGRFGFARNRAVLALACLCVASIVALLGIGASPALAGTPTLTMNAVTSPGYASAHLSGDVEVPADGYQTYWCLEYAEETVGNWSGFCYQGPIQPGETATVETNLSGLKPGTAYEARLSAFNFTEFLEEHSGTQTFTTEAVNPPEAEINGAGSVNSDSAHLSGTVNSGGSGAGEKAGTYSFSCSPGCPSAEGPHEFQAEGLADGADHAIQADAEGLLPNTEYRVTLSAQNAAGQESNQIAFTTDASAPEAITAFVAPRTTTTARLNAYVTPNNSDTTYFFQYGPNDCSANACTSVPLSEDASVSPTDMESHIVSQEVEGLSESTTYHYRVVAENSAGTVAGVDKTFETRSAAEMALAPRGYELVNPPDKGNQHIFPTFESDGLGGREGLMSAPDGEAAAWEVFAGAPGATALSKNPFLSTRGPNGWSTISMVGPADEQYGDGNQYFKLASVSSDLSHFILATGEGVLAHANSAVVRADRAGNQEVLLTVPNANYGLVGSVDVSADAQHVFSTGQDAGGLFDYGSGVPEDVALMPDGSSPACGISRFYDWHAIPGYHWIARNGSRIFFESKGNDCSSPAAIYVRDRETEETIQVAPKGAFIRASRDGKRAVISTDAALTGEDPNSTVDLYMWSEASGNKCLTCSVPNAEVAACAGDCGTNTYAVEVPEDLSRVYFSSGNTLVPSEHRGGGAYVAMADGSIHYAGDLPVSSPWAGERTPNLTPDGRGVLFASGERVTDDDIACLGTCSQIYYYDDVTRSIECVSCVPGGVTKQTGSTHGAEVSADGQTIAFETQEKLLPSDVNGGSDFYQWHNGKLGLITDGVTKYPAGQPGEESLGGAPTIRGISTTGRDIFFTIVAPLTGFEQDGFSNLYDARIGGGFPPPIPPVHCEGDACQGSLEAPPASVRSASSTFSGNGNVSEGGQARCRRAKVRRKGRCVSKRPSCRKQAKAKKRCAKSQASTGQKRSQRNDRGGAK
jgi:hypothetical protein